MKDLISTLGDLGIEPIGSEPRPNIYTHHMVVSAGGQAVATEEGPPPDQPEPTPAASVPAPMAKIEAAESLLVQVGDRVVVRFGDKQNSRTLVLREEGLDLNNGIITLEHPLGEALLNRSEDDEIEYEFDGRMRTAAILKVEKSALNISPIQTQ
jgi:hypothetical protein